MFNRGTATIRGNAVYKEARYIETVRNINYDFVSPLAFRRYIEPSSVTIRRILRLIFLNLFIGEQFYIQFLLACINIPFIFYFLMHYLLFVSIKVMQL